MFCSFINDSLIDFNITRDEEYSHQFFPSFVYIQKTYINLLFLYQIFLPAFLYSLDIVGKKSVKKGSGYVLRRRKIRLGDKEKYKKRNDAVIYKKQSIITTSDDVGTCHLSLNHFTAAYKSLYPPIRPFSSLSFMKAVEVGASKNAGLFLFFFFAFPPFPPTLSLSPFSLLWFPSLLKSSSSCQRKTRKICFLWDKNNIL